MVGLDGASLPTTTVVIVVVVTTVNSNTLTSQPHPTLSTKQEMSTTVGWTFVFSTAKHVIWPTLLNYNFMSIKPRWRSLWDYEEEAHNPNEESQYVFQSLSPDYAVDLPRFDGFLLLKLVQNLKRSSIRFWFICFSRCFAFQFLSMYIANPLLYVCNMCI